MNQIERAFIEFSGDPKNDKECILRYSSTEPFKPTGFDDEVIEFVNVKEHNQVLEAGKEALLGMAGLVADKKYLEKNYGDKVSDCRFLHEKVAKQAKEIVRLERVIARELTENDELGCEYTYVNVLKRENAALSKVMGDVEERCDLSMNAGRKIDPFVLKRELLQKRVEIEKDGL